MREPLESELAEAQARRDELAARWAEREGRARPRQGDHAADRRVADGGRARGATRRPAAGRGDPLRRAARPRAGAPGARRGGQGRGADGQGGGRRGRRRRRRRHAGRESPWTGCWRARSRSSSTWRSGCTGASSDRTPRSTPSPTRCGAHAPACRTRTARSARSSSSARPGSARPSLRGRSRSSCSTTSARWCVSTCPSTWRSTPSRASSAPRPGTSATTRAVS